MTHHRPSETDFDPADLHRTDPRKQRPAAGGPRLMVPAVADPHVLVVGDFVTGHKFYGPTSDNRDDGNLHTRILLLDDTGRNYSLVPLRPLAELHPIGDDPDEPDPVEVKRAEFLRMAAKAREVTAEADRLTELGAAAVSSAHTMRQLARDVTVHALALAEELLA
jgi:hypothetical protein